MADNVETVPQVAPKLVSKLKLPELKEFLKSGVQFGHESKRWNPKMQSYIFTKKNHIHIIDLSQTLPLLQAAGDAMAEKAQLGPILFLGTKRQAAEIVKEAAISAGAHYITNRWAGGLLTNFDNIKKSINKLNDLERQFNEGITGRTKYEISLMKKDWERLHRLYGGVKNLKTRPAAVFVVDPGFESGAIRECNYLDVPIIAMVDTNSDPTIIDFPIPANDDAIGSIKLVVGYITERLMESKSPFKVEHVYKDYTKTDVSIKKEGIAQVQTVESSAAITAVAEPAIKATTKPQETRPGKAEKSAKAAGKTTKSASGEGQSGILGKFQEQKEQAKKTQPRK